MQTASPLSEFSIIQRIAARLPEYTSDVIKGIGDDTAVIKVDKNKYLLLTCDTQVSGEHFLEKYSSPYQVGKKAAAVNISDIAAMGGKPKYMLVSLFLPKNISQKYIDEVYRGLTEECNKYSIKIIGGNISKSNQFIIDIFLIGEINPKYLLLRSGAKVGDLVLVTGTVGDAAAGFQLLLKKKVHFNAKNKQTYISKFLTPTPRLKEGIFIAHTKKATSMIDISDGLSSDLGHVCDESKVGVKIFEDKLPFSTTVDLALNGGEDYELCFTVDKKDEKFFPNAAIIGEIIPEKEGRWLIDKKGHKRKLEPKGWDHLFMVSEVEP